MNGQSNSLYAAVYAAEFPAQAFLRLRPDLQSQPVVVLDGSPPQERVCALNLHARKRGVVNGMTRLEVEELSGIHILSRSLETEQSARAVLLECVSQFSPRIEETFAQEACGFVLDISGTERLFGPPKKLAPSLRAVIASAGFRVSIAISANFDTSRIKAEYARGISIIPIKEEAQALANVSITALNLEEEHYDTFALWGIRTLGELAELPQEELIARMGQQSTYWLQLSRGIASHTFQPIEATFELKEHVEFETHVEQIDSLLFIGSNMIHSLVARASGRALCIAALTVQMALEESLIYQRVIRPALPSNDRKFLLKLLQLEIASHPPQAAVMALTLSAEAGHPSKVQLGLFAPQTPEPSWLDVTLARLKALVGSDRVGSPLLRDTHRSGSFVMEEFEIAEHRSAEPRTQTRPSLRRVRPPHPLHMRLRSLVPAEFRDGADRYEVQTAYGPWHSSGSWWSIDQWDLDEWDVMAVSGAGETVGCLIIYDHLQKKWLLDAYYD